MTFQFEIPGEPVPWQRVKRAADGHAYVPDETRRFKQKVQMCALTSGVRRINGAVHMGFVFYVSKPPTFTKRDGDGDNLQKSVMDALNGVAYGDDSQVKSWQGLILLDPAKPRTKVTIESIPDWGDEETT
jgi:crossover junction endodeoxyribonuclease RusA